MCGFVGAYIASGGELVALKHVHVAGQHVTETHAFVLAGGVVTANGPHARLVAEAAATVTASGMSLAELDDANEAGRAQWSRIPGLGY